jgi:hypothetical protein
MPKYQTRKVQLRKGDQKAEIENGEGHVWNRQPGGGTIGFPLYDAKQEQKIFEQILEMYRADGFEVVADTGLSAEVKAKRPAGMTAKTWTWVQHTDQALGMWRDGNYDNHKDAIFDARDLLAGAPSDQATRVSRLNGMLTKATNELRSEALRYPEIAEYARGIIDLQAPRKKPAAKKPAAKKTAASRTRRKAPVRRRTRSAHRS